MLEAITVTHLGLTSPLTHELHRAQAKDTLNTHRTRREQNQGRGNEKMAVGSVCVCVVCTRVH